jgi:peptide/nickel transport system substrate-binding protein
MALGNKPRRVTANDFVFSFNRLLNPKLASPGAWVLKMVEQNSKGYAMQALNDTTFEITLKKPFPAFLSLLAMQYCSVVPHEAVEHYGDDFRRHPVGTGPFTLSIWKEGVKMVLLKNENYFESSHDGKMPFLDAVSVTFVIDKLSAFLEFTKGNLDFISGIDASYKDEILTPSGLLQPKFGGIINFSKQAYLNTEYLGILIDTTQNISKNSALKNKYVRQAINYGFDREKMIRYLRNGIGTPGTSGFVPPGIPGFDHLKVNGYTFDRSKALQLLRKAGYPGGAGLPPITLITNASYLDLCKFIQSQLSEIGIKIKIEVTPPATLREMIARSKSEFFRGSWIADYPDAENYLSLFYSPNFCPKGPNYTHYYSKIFDDLYQKALVQTDDKLRTATYQQMDNLIMQDAPVVILFYDEVLRFTRKNISGLGSNPLNLLNLKQVKKTNEY